MTIQLYTGSFSGVFIIIIIIWWDNNLMIFISFKCFRSKERVENCYFLDLVLAMWNTDSCLFEVIMFRKFFFIWCWRKKRGLVQTSSSYTFVKRACIIWVFGIIFTPSMFFDNFCQNNLLNRISISTNFTKNCFALQFLSTWYVSIFFTYDL